MEFKTEAQKAVYEKVKGYAIQLFGETINIPADRPVLGYQHGSAYVSVFIFPFMEDNATVCVRSWIITGAELTPDLMRYLLNENDNMRFGAFGVDDDGDIFFEHTIVGSTCDKEELKASMWAVAGTADKYDDEIRQRWGGQRACDRVG